MHSQVDSPSFFNSPSGKKDPRAELEATLRSFFAEAAEGDDHPQCRFAARRAWLDAELGFDAQRIARRECPRFREWRTAIDASQLTLVFASAYVDNPGSMYGHTLLRVDAAGQDERTRLLAYTINFAAGTDETSGFLYVLKGLFGGYPGVFSMLPYYLKVREYSDLENRDLWEYQLDLGGEEIERVLAHAWELLPIHFDYFFFDENCAYHLLGLLQVARADLELTAQFPLWALPVDTVRVLTDQPGWSAGRLSPVEGHDHRRALALLRPAERAWRGTWAGNAGTGRFFAAPARRAPPQSSRRDTTISTTGAGRGRARCRMAARLRTSSCWRAARSTRLRRPRAPSRGHGPTRATAPAASRPAPGSATARHLLSSACGRPTTTCSTTMPATSAPRKSSSSTCGRAATKAATYASRASSQ
jgi:hypothetical protein